MDMFDRQRAQQYRQHEHLKRASQRRRRQGQWQLIAAAFLTLLLLLLGPLSLSGPPRAFARAAGQPSQGPASSALSQCGPAWLWPLRGNAGSAPKVTESFQNPAQPWMQGHRGVDLQAHTGQEIFAPAAGKVSFAGKVAGKDVVSFQVGRLTSTFEPAVATLAVGEQVESGQIIAHVGGGSDHCQDQCMHWGVKAGSKTYRNPLSQVHPHKIVLKPQAP
ncbi:hypothetical protein KIM372_09040 [Bombiscardovia nodaiensis]|uniref:M23ase beta-sheet core domain-containing protein n=1 Tax=Bombiscardovia nodaiensis TaxID=2932181 RepID=A0ABN6SD12_9BIFI|nr:hypothetical protein KIM372_09040 [Bombiscardovia nodaiensis]